MVYFAKTRKTFASLIFFFKNLTKPLTVFTGASVQINVEIFVKPELVASLNSGDNKLSTIVVLRLNGGKDYFLSISGQFIPTCFGLPLRLLLSLETAPVAWLPVQELQKKVNLLLHLFDAPLSMTVCFYLRKIFHCFSIFFQCHNISSTELSDRVII